MFRDFRLRPNRGFLCIAVLCAAMLGAGCSQNFTGEPSSSPGPGALAHQHTPLVRDWSSRHLLYPHIGTLGRLNAVASDPRAQFAWHDWERAHPFRFGVFPGRPLPPPWIRRFHSMTADWAVTLGGGTVAPAQFPAKYTFDINATPSCANDFVVFPVDVNGGAAQANLAALNNLYTGGTANNNRNGLCANRTIPGGITDHRWQPTVLWSYNVHAIAAGAAVPTSPTLSMDGAKVAFVESAAGNPAHFHVLAWKTGDGRTANYQHTTSPKAITSFISSAPASGSGTATDLALGSSTSGTDTISSPFIDYVRDQAYVGNDIGVLYRINNVFCEDGNGNPLPGCSAAPSLDTSWGTSGAVTVCSGRLSGPVMDFTTLNVYVGCADGKLYGFDSTGKPLPTPSIAVGNGSATGDIEDPPIVDGVRGFVYAISGTGAAPNSGSAVVVQVTTALGGPCAGNTPCVATVGNPGLTGENIHAPAFNDPYFSSANSATWLLYMGGFTGAGNSTLTLYGIPFSASGALGTGTPAQTSDLGSNVGDYSPLTEFLNGSTDWLFAGVLYAAAGGNVNVASININSFPTCSGAGCALAHTAAEGGGPSGIIIDNDSTSAQASSIYFGTQSCNGTGGCANGNSAVKLTQSALQ